MTPTKPDPTAPDPTAPDPTAPDPALNLLGFPKPSADTRVVVAMSGGVDSSVTAALLVEAGFEVVGITLQLYDHGAATGRAKACCAGQDIMDARAVADQLGIPHYVLDYESRFRAQVIDDFADSYLRGETPIPCVRCNQTVKFTDLLATARDLNAECLATGHYVRRAGGLSGASLWRGADPAKDQSYFLFATTQTQLDFLRFPLGHLSKDQTRAIAARHALAVADKPDSQDICFVPQGDYRRVIQALRPDAGRAGEIRHLDGRVLGHHRGILGYTIGQRRGLGLGAGETDGQPLYVVAVDPVAAVVTVGPRAALARDRVLMETVNWIGGDAPSAAVSAAAQGTLSVKLRNNMTPVAAVLELPDGAVGQGGAAVRLATPVHGLSPGQACVLYAGERVLGGGWISGSAQTPALARQVATQLDPGIAIAPVA